MLTLRPVDYSTLNDIISLHVAEHQRSFVADNAFSIMEAYIALSKGETALPFGIYLEDTAIGFVMFGYGRAGYAGEPDCAEGSCCIWRFMIDQLWQGRGYGRQALALALKYLYTQPTGPAKACWLSYAPENMAARALYASMGFVENGEHCGSEIVAVRPL